MSIRKTIILFAAFAFFSAMLGGYFYFSNAQRLALEHEHEKAKDFIVTQKVHLSALIEAYQREAKLLAGQNTVQKALVVNNPSALSESAFEGIVIHDRGVILEANELFAMLFGYEIHEIINMKLLIGM